MDGAGFRPPEMHGRSDLAFPSVREAVKKLEGTTRFGFNVHHHLSSTDVELIKVEEQTVKSEMDLFTKERETLAILKELETTKRMAYGLQSRIQKQASEMTRKPDISLNDMKVHPVSDYDEKRFGAGQNQNGRVVKHLGQNESAGLILKELKLAREYLNKTTTGVSGTEASIELLKRKIVSEKASMKVTSERLRSKKIMIASMENELSRTKVNLMRVKDSGNTGSVKRHDELLSEFKRLVSERDKYKKMTEDAKSEICKLTADIEETRCKIKTTEVRWITAKNVEAAARSGEAVARREIKVSTEQKDSEASKNESLVTISADEYSAMIRKAQEAGEVCRRKVESVMLELKEAQRAKVELLEKVEEATAEVEASREALREALKREEDAKRAKIAVEEDLLKWRSKYTKKRHSFRNTAKFKNATSGPNRILEYQILDVNGVSMVTRKPSNLSRPTLSIGQILNRKLTIIQDNDSHAIQKVRVKPRVSLQQFLNINNEIFSPLRIETGSCEKQLSAKKKFGLFAFSLFLANQKKKQGKT